MKLRSAGRLLFPLFAVFLVFTIFLAFHASITGGWAKARPPKEKEEVQESESPPAEDLAAPTTEEEDTSGAAEESAPLEAEEAPASQTDIEEPQLTEEQSAPAEAEEASLFDEETEDSADLAEISNPASQETVVPQAQATEAVLIEGFAPFGSAAELEQEAWNDVHYAVETCLMNSQTQEARQAVGWIPGRDVPAEILSQVHYVNATAAYYEEDFDTAREEYLKMTTCGAPEKHVVSGKQAAACCLMAKTEYSAAIAEYEALIASHPSFPEACAEARYQIATMLCRQEEYESAQIQIQSILTDYPETSWAVDAQEKSGDIESLLSLAGGN